MNIKTRLARLEGNGSDVATIGRMSWPDGKIEYGGRTFDRVEDLPASCKAVFPARMLTDKEWAACAAALPGYQAQLEAEFSKEIHHVTD